VCLCEGLYVRVIITKLRDPNSPLYIYTHTHTHTHTASRGPGAGRDTQELVACAGKYSL
jgi:hypothetical protein